MADDKNSLPEGTDTVIAGAAITEPTERNARDDEGGTLTIENVDLTMEDDTPASRSSTGSSPEGRLSDRLRSGRGKIASQAGEKARGLVTQGLDRAAEALANVSRMVGDTAPGIEERLGEEYGDYARRAAGAIENAANTIAEKNPDELIDDTRNFVRNSPGVALAGAAVVGFVVARLIKSGLSTTEDDDEDDRA